MALIGFWYPKNGKAAHADGNSANNEASSSGGPTYASVAASGGKAKED